MLYREFHQFEHMYRDVTDTHTHKSVQRVRGANTQALSSTGGSCSSCIVHDMPSSGEDSPMAIPVIS